MITRNNYETYFLDYHEGTLDASLHTELFSFLEDNPDLKEEFESFSFVVIDSDHSLRFPDKRGLHRKVTLSENELLTLIAYMEGDLSEREKAGTDNLLQTDPQAADALEILRKTRIFPDPEIVYRDKQELKKEASILTLSSAFYRITAIAASLALLIISYSIFFKDRQQNEMAKSDTQIPVHSTTQETIAGKVEQTASLPETRKEELPGNIPEATPVRTIQKSSPKEESLSGQGSLAAFTGSEKESLFVPAEDTYISTELPPDHASDEPAFVHTIPVLEKAEASVNQTADLSSVFSEAELAELGLSNDTKNNQSGFFQLAHQGARVLSERTGAKIGVDRKQNGTDQSTVYALEIGKFSLSHVRKR